MPWTEVDFVNLEYVTEVKLDAVQGNAIHCRDQLDGSLLGAVKEIDVFRNTTGTGTIKGLIELYVGAALLGSREFVGEVENARSKIQNMDLTSFAAGSVQTLTLVARYARGADAYPTRTTEHERMAQVYMVPDFTRCTLIFGYTLYIPSTGPRFQVRGINLLGHRGNRDW